MVDAPVERRRHRRRRVRASSRFRHDVSGREYPCRLADLSAGGARLIVPATTPLRPGHAVRLLASPATGEDDRFAEVVRVDRESLLADGYIRVAVRFLPS